MRCDSGEGWMEIDLKMNKRTYVPVPGQLFRWPAIGATGTARSAPTAPCTFAAAQRLRALPSQKLIRTLATWKQSRPFPWNTSVGGLRTTGSPPSPRTGVEPYRRKTGKWPTTPLLDKITIYQIWTDGRSNHS